MKLKSIFLGCINAVVKAQDLFAFQLEQKQARRSPHIYGAFVANLIIDVEPAEVVSILWFCCCG